MKRRKFWIVFSVLCFSLAILCAGFYLNFDKNIYLARLGKIIKSEMSLSSRLDLNFKSMDLKKFFVGEIVLLDAIFLDGGDLNQLSIDCESIVIYFSWKDLFYKKINIKKLVLNEPRVFISKSYRRVWNPFVPQKQNIDSQESDWKTSVKRWDFVDAEIVFFIAQENSTLSYGLKNTSIIFSRNDGEVTSDIWKIEGMGNVAKTNEVINFVSEYSWAADNGLLLLSYGDEKLAFEGEFSKLREQAILEGTLTLSDWNAQSLAVADALTMEGRLRLQGDFFVQGYDFREWLASVRGEGSLEINEGSLQGVNPFISLKNIFIEEYPNLQATDSLGEIFVENLKILEFKDQILFHKTQADFAIDQGHVSLSTLLVHGEDYMLDLAGQLSSKEKSVEFYGEAVLSNKAARAWIDGFQQFNFEINSKERLVLLLNYRGILPYAQFDTDRDYLDSIYKYDEVNTKQDDAAPIDLQAMI